MRGRRRRWAGGFLAASVSFTGCGVFSDDTTRDARDQRPAGCSPQVAARDGTVRLVTSVAPLTDIVADLAAGTRTEIVGIVPEGVDSHTFTPGPNAALHLERADLVVLNGLGLEIPIRELALADMRDDAVLCELGDEILPESEFIFDVAFPEAGGVPNPHLWTNPPMVQEYALVVHELLVAAMPDESETLAANLAEFSDRIAELDEAIRAAVRTIPADQRRLVTYHDAYAYFAREYGFSVIGAVQPSSFDEPAPREIARLIDQIETTGVTAIFGSEVFPSPVLEQIAAEAGATYVDDLRDDDLPGDPGDAGHSWVGLMTFNLITIVEALGGDAAALRAIDNDPTPIR